MATHSTVLAWSIPGTGEPGGLQSMGLHRVGHDWSNLAAAAAIEIREEKEMKGIQIRKEVKMSLLVGDMILFIENPKDATRKWLDLISELGKTARYKTNTQKYLYTLTMKDQKEELVIPLTIILERIKYLELHLLKETKNLYSEDFKTLMKEIEDYTNRWKHTSCSCIGRINIVKMTIPIKAIGRFDAMPIKLPMAFFHRTRTKNFHICRET